MAASGTFRAAPSLARYFADLGACAPLTAERERDLARNARAGCADALSQLVRANLPFVVRLAREYGRFGMPFEDLLGEGNLGLLEAARRFDPERGARFSTCAGYWIRKAILTALNDRATLVRVPSYMRRKIREHQLAGLGADALRRRDTGWLLLREQSLDAPLGQHDDSTLLDTLPDGACPSAEHVLLRREVSRKVRAALDRLDSRERAVIAMRFGLDGRPALLLHEIGELLGVSRERARQHEAQALASLRRRLAAKSSSQPAKARRSGRRRAAAAQRARQHDEQNDGRQADG